MTVATITVTEQLRRDLRNAKERRRRRGEQLTSSQPRTCRDNLRHIVTHCVTNAGCGFFKGPSRELSAVRRRSRVPA